MGAIWQKNQPTASLRRCDLLPANDDDGTPAPRETDFTGYVYISQDGNDYEPGLGTIVNCRRALVVADDVFTADNATETFTAVAHGLETGDGPIWVSNSGGALPSGLSASTNYWVIRVTDDTFQLATTLALAYAGTELLITTDGTGTQTLSDVGTPNITQRGLDGKFRYTASQAETNFDTAEIAVIIAGHATYSAYTTVDMATESAATWETVIEGAYTASDLLRGIARQNLASRTIVGTVETTRDLADTKDSHHGTITASVRTATIDDLT